METPGSQGAKTPQWTARKLLGGIGQWRVIHENVDNNFWPGPAEPEDSGQRSVWSGSAGSHGGDHYGSGSAGSHGGHHSLGPAWHGGRQRASCIFARSWSTALVCIWQTRDSVTPRTCPISARVSPS
jgi:hypothetical protein